MDDDQRRFLDDLLSTATPSGFETAGQRVWLDYVDEFADETRVDAYGNAVAVHEGDPDAPSVAVTGHCDEIGLMVRDITDDGFLKLSSIGGSDRTVTRGQNVHVHTDDGVVDGVIGQVAIHLRDATTDEYADINEQYVDVGAEDGDEARELVDVGDPITFDTEVRDLRGDRVAARGMDNRVGIWTAAEAFRRAAESDPAATVYAVSTVQEEVGLKGAKMVGFDLEPDVAVAVDVTHATDHPEGPGDKGSGIELGEGAVVSRGSANHPELVALARDAAADDDADVQLQATGSFTGTDADAFYTTRGGIPSLNVAIPNRYMHTPVEVVDLADLESAAALLAGVAARSAEAAPFGVDI
ncbi:M20/M25/M40 family metallo-hydrolase [Natronomonas salina]|uniref:M20/M25/M40 family metallo-hydrolase n=1 Tax=Natronomonas salina TaxID=1710540 RepID=UPI0015B5D5EE|nr:M20/M25/M40 family metallo-hydrolase [Natronomonas salina]QLD87886.1 M20/M25/M40 family metallo-hydrolase [Natronomonas salina]